MHPKPGENSPMSARAEAKLLMREIAGPGEPGESVKAAIRRVATKLQGWSANRIRDVWDADPRIRISAEEMDRLRAAARRDRQEEAEAKDAFRLILTRLNQIEAILQADPYKAREVAAEGERRTGADRRSVDR